MMYYQVIFVIYRRDAVRNNQILQYDYENNMTVTY